MYYVPWAMLDPVGLWVVTHPWGHPVGASDGPVFGPGLETD